MEIEDLDGVGPATVKKLRELGYHTVEKLATTTMRRLEEDGFAGKNAQKILQGARKAVFAGDDFATAFDLMQRRNDIHRLTSGVRAIDELMGGGLEPKTINEFCGEYRVGKSVLCHQFCVTVQLPFDKGGLNGGALYLDTEQTFRPEWVKWMAPRFGLAAEETLKNITIPEQPITNTDQQLLALRRADSIIKEKNIRLIVVDSVTAHFRSEYEGREELAPRQQTLNNHLSQLAKWTEVFNLVAVITNQVMANPSPFGGFLPVQIGGHILKHASHVIFFIRPVSGSPSHRIITLDTSLINPPGERHFKITGQGVEDVPEEELKKKKKIAEVEE